MRLLTAGSLVRAQQGEPPGRAYESDGYGICRLFSFAVKVSYLFRFVVSFRQNTVQDTVQISLSFMYNAQGYVVIKRGAIRGDFAGRVSFYLEAAGWCKWVA